MSRMDSPLPGPAGWPPSTLTVHAAEHRGGLRRAEVAGVERLEVGRRKRLELVDRDVLAGAGVAGAVEAEDAVGVGDLVVGQAAELLGRGCRVGAGRGRARGMGERSGALAEG